MLQVLLLHLHLGELHGPVQLVLDGLDDEIGRDAGEGLDTVGGEFRFDRQVDASHDPDPEQATFGRVLRLFGNALALDHLGDRREDVIQVGRLDPRRHLSRKCSDPR